MIRGTTPTLEFTLPFDTADIAEGYITFTQRGQKVLERSVKDADKSENKLTLKLTQEETLELSATRDVKIQARIRMTNGDAVASEIITAPVREVLRDGVI